jgi:hypothetical protein
MGIEFSHSSYVLWKKNPTFMGRGSRVIGSDDICVTIALALSAKNFANMKPG